VDKKKARGIFGAAQICLTLPMGCRGRLKAIVNNSAQTHRTIS
jgi:hypothetical protein